MERSFVDWLLSEAPERRVYEGPPLALALCQVRFSKKFNLDDAMAGLFQEAIEDQYPYSRRAQALATLQATLQIEEADEQVGLQAQAPEIQWRFTDGSGNWTVTLTRDFVTLETRSYDRFEDFLERLVWVLDALARTVRPRTAIRVGLRYINEIRSEHERWDEIIAKDLVGPLAIEAFRQNVLQSVQAISIHAEEAQITLQHGVLDGTTVRPKPGTTAPTDAFYLIDIDMFQEFGPPNSLHMDSREIANIVERFHGTVSALFRWATTTEYRRSLGERSDVR